MLRVEKVSNLAKDRNKEIFNEVMEKKAHYISWAKVGSHSCAYDFCIYGLKNTDVDAYTMFDTVNRRKETGTLYPQVNMTFLPIERQWSPGILILLNYIEYHDKEYTREEEALHLQDALIANRDYIKSKKVYFDIRNKEPFSIDENCTNNILSYYGELINELIAKENFGGITDVVILCNHWGCGDFLWEGFKIGDLVRFGCYDWRVLDMRRNSALLLSDKIIEKRSFKKGSGGKLWPNSSLREYLNREFYNSFNTEEQSRIKDYIPSNTINPWYPSAFQNKRKLCVDYWGQGESFDKIFLLNIQQVVDYFGDSGQLKNRPMQSIEEAWHEDGYSRYISDQYNESRIARNADGEICYWWLMTCGGQPCSAIAVAPDGTINMHGFLPFYYGSISDFGVRPALWMKI